MRNLIRHFQADEGGAVTVDWVVLTAAIIGLGMVVVAPIGLTADSAAHSVSNDIRDVDLPYDLN